MGEFRNLQVQSSNTVNGEKSIWTVSFDAIASVSKDDLFKLEIPSTIRTPTDPICEAIKCLIPEKSDNTIPCSAERGQIIVTLNPKEIDECTKYGATFTFTIGKGDPKVVEPWNGITNAASSLTSNPLKAHWSTALY